jgi:heme exporter protein C
MMGRRANAVFGTLWCTSGLALIAALALMIWYAPIDPLQGAIQKIFYLHLGVAMGTLIGALGVLVGSVGYLWQRDPRWDCLADASARIAILLLFVVMATGAVWAKQVWGRWWEWNPPLTFSLILWLLYVAYLAIRRALAGSERRAAVAASFGLLASLDVPLVYLSVRFLPSSHLSAGERGPEMGHTVLVWVVAIALLAVSMIWTRYLIGAAPRAEVGSDVPVRSTEDAAAFPARGHA